MMRDLSSAKMMYVKAGMFVVIGGSCAVLLVLQNPTWRTAALLAIAIWSFCRAYYFAFYVIEKWVDPGFRFSGLWSFAKHTLSRSASRRGGGARMPERGEGTKTS